LTFWWKPFQKKQRLLNGEQHIKIKETEIKQQKARNQDLRQSRSDWQKIARQAEDCSEWCAFVDAVCSPYGSYG